MPGCVDMWLLGEKNPTSPLGESSVQLRWGCTDTETLHKCSAETLAGTDHITGVA